MKVVQLSAVSFGYDQQRLFRDVTFMLTRGSRAALVAPNGAGKTTLLRLIAGELSPDEGTITFARDTQWAYYRQSHELVAEGTVREALLSGFEEVLAIRAELSRAEEDAASGTDQALARLAAVMDRYQLAGGDEVERRIDMVAQKLGFGADDMERPVASLSGGERGRLRLGTTLTQPADLLLLDEPTNHLDLETIDWLEKYLCGLACAVLVVSHDRAFLDAVCPQTLELGRRSFRVYPLPYSRYVEAREADLEHERARVEHQRAQIAKTEDFIRRNIAAQKTKQAQSRRKMLDKLERLEVPEDVWAVAERVRFRFAEAPRSGDMVLEAAGVGAARAGRLLFDEFELLVRRGDRIGVLGPNGCGKTTLLHLLAGQGSDEDRGKVRRGTNLCVGFYDQHLGTLDTSRSAIEEIRSIRGELNEDVTRNYLARFRFWGDDPFRKVAALSGGERARLALAKLLLEPLNLLFLDEPTNHLDIPAAEILEQALCDFPGSLLVASHDRRFLETVTTRIVAFVPSSGGSSEQWHLETYEGNFRDYVDQCERRAAPAAGPIELEPQRSKPAAKPKPTAVEAARRVARSVSTAGAAAVAAAGTGQAAYEEEKRARRELERKRRRVNQLEQEIGEVEEELERMREQLRRPPGENWLDVAKLAEQEQNLQRQAESKIAEWAELSEELSEMTSLADDEQ